MPSNSLDLKPLDYSNWDAVVTRIETKKFQSRVCLKKQKKDKQWLNENNKSKMKNLLFSRSFVTHNKGYEGSERPYHENKI